MINLKKELPLELWSNYIALVFVIITGIAILFRTQNALTESVLGSASAIGFIIYVLYTMSKYYNYIYPTKLGLIKSFAILFCWSAYVLLGIVYVINIVRFGAVLSGDSIYIAFITYITLIIAFLDAFVNLKIKKQ